MLSKILALLLLIIVPFQSIGQNATTQTSASELWSDTDSWTGGVVPGCFDTIFIPV